MFIKIGTALTIVGVIGVSACSLEGAAQRTEAGIRGDVLGDETLAIDFFNKPLIVTIDYALRLSEGYKENGDRIATNRDAIAFGLIGIATYAALGPVGVITTLEAAQAGLAGLAINEGVKFTEPNSSAGHFYVASREVACIGYALAETYGASNDLADNDAQAVIITQAAIVEAQLRLRSNLSRSIPDFKALGEIIKAAESLIEGNGGGNTQAAPGASGNLGGPFATLQQQIIGCAKIAVDSVKSGEDDGDATPEPETASE